MIPLTRQEMFNRAYLGLRSQGFERCMSESGCTYSDGNGNHCAFGWIDLSLDQKGSGVVCEKDGSRPADAIDGDLCKSEIADALSIGGRICCKSEIADALSIEDRKWARALQIVHDDTLGREMKNRLEAFAAKSGLTVPE